MCDDAVYVDEAEFSYLVVTQAFAPQPLAVTKMLAPYAPDALFVESAPSPISTSCVRPGRHLHSQQLLHETSLLCFVLLLNCLCLFPQIRRPLAPARDYLQPLHSFQQSAADRGATKMVRGTGRGDLSLWQQLIHCSRIGYHHTEEG
jgi:hypothetical protein